MWEFTTQLYFYSVLILELHLFKMTGSRGNLHVLSDHGTRPNFEENLLKNLRVILLEQIKRE